MRKILAIVLSSIVLLASCAREPDIDTTIFVTGLLVAPGLRALEPKDFATENSDVALYEGVVVQVTILSVMSWGFPTYTNHAVTMTSLGSLFHFEDPADYEPGVVLKRGVKTDPTTGKDVAGYYPDKTTRVNDRLRSPTWMSK